MTKTLATLALTGCLISTAALADVTFEHEGRTWTVIGSNTPISRNHMFPNAHVACPSLKVKLESVKVTARNGGPMTRDQKNREDKRWHVVCIRN